MFPQAEGPPPLQSPPLLWPLFETPSQGSLSAPVPCPEHLLRMALLTPELHEGIPRAQSPS